MLLLRANHKRSSPQILKGLLRRFLGLRDCICRHPCSRRLQTLSFCAQALPPGRSLALEDLNHGGRCLRYLLTLVMHGNSDPCACDRKQLFVGRVQVGEMQGKG
jgi:hypothetical protein